MSYNTLKENLLSVNEQLRRSFDSDDPIRTAFRIGGLRRSGGRRGSRQVPDWAFNPKKFRKILLRSFPRMKEKIGLCQNDHRYCRCSFHQRWLAARWVYITHLYWGVGLTNGQIACQLNVVDIGDEGTPGIWNPNKVKMVLRHLNLAAHNLRANGSGKITGGKTGRPKKIRDTTAASITGEKHESRSDRQGTLLLPSTPRGAVRAGKVQLP